MKKARTFVRAFLSQPSGEVDELNYANACPSGFCLRQKFISPTSQIDKKRGKSFNLPLFYLNPLKRSRRIELRLRLPCGFLPLAKILSPTSQIENEKSPNFRSSFFISTLWRPHGDSNPGSWNENPMS